MVCFWSCSTRSHGKANPSAAHQTKVFDAWIMPFLAARPQRDLVARSCGGMSIPHRLQEVSHISMPYPVSGLFSHSKQEEVESGYCKFYSPNKLRGLLRRWYFPFRKSHSTRRTRKGLVVGGPILASPHLVIRVRAFSSGLIPLRWTMAGIWSCSGSCAWFDCCAW